MNQINVFTDGGSRGNPGPAGIGIYIETENHEVLYMLGKTIGLATNNVAEYTAVLYAFMWLKENGAVIASQKKIMFYLDSLLIVSQLTGVYKIKNKELQKLVIVIRAFEQQVGKRISYLHIPREHNTRADRLVNLALDGKI